MNKTNGAQPVSHDIEARYERYRETIKKFTLMSDIFMRNVFKDKACVEYVLQVIMDMPDLRVQEYTLQKDYKNLQGRSAILDCVAASSDGRVFNIEIQQEDEGASPKRARYHSGLMDMNVLRQGQGFDKLPECHVIFITRDDVLGHGLPIYHIRRKIDELNADFGDESQIIYVNSQKRDNTELGRLMHDMNCIRADQMYSKTLAARVRELKETEKGVDAMCKEVEELIEESKMETAQSLAEMGMPLDKIAYALKTDAAVVAQWLEKGTASVR